MIEKREDWSGGPFLLSSVRDVEKLKLMKEQRLGEEMKRTFKTCGWMELPPYWPLAA